MAQRGKNKEAVAIAQDVINQINLKRYRPQTGVYIGPNFKPGDLQSQLLKMDREGKKCTACALGSVFISTVRLHDNYEVPVAMRYNSVTDDWDIPTKQGGDISDADMLVPKLTEFFTEEEIGRIEACFEQEDSFLRGADIETASIWDHAPNPAHEFSSMVGELDQEERLITIMKEVVRQNGNFNAEKANRQARKVKAIADDIKSSAMETAVQEAYDAR